MGWKAPETELLRICAFSRQFFVFCAEASKLLKLLEGLAGLRRIFDLRCAFLQRCAAIVEDEDRAFVTLRSDYEIVKERAGGMVLADYSERFYFTRWGDGSGEREWCEGGEVDEGVGEK